MSGSFSLGTFQNQSFLPLKDMKIFKKTKNNLIVIFKNLNIDIYKVSLYSCMYVKKCKLGEGYVQFNVQESRCSKRIEE